MEEMMTRKPAEVFPPGEYVKDELDARGWSQVEFAEILGRPARVVSEIVNGKRSITPETAKEIAAAFGSTPELWMNLESIYRLSRVKNDESVVARRSRLYQAAPVKEMLRRSWIRHSATIEVLERQVLDFFGIGSLDEEPQFWPFAARKSAESTPLTRAWLLAWLFRARRLAKSVHAKRFGSNGMKRVLDGLRKLLHEPEEIRHVPEVLAEGGIRFLVLEHLPQTRLDGACFWLDEQSPVVVLSLRYDRIDCFWHTLMHEIGHVDHRDGLRGGESVDVDLFGRRPGAPATEEFEIERAADAFATGNLIAPDELENFIARVGPLYSQQRIRGFARRLGVHPGIVVGQLQFRGEIDYAQHRRMLAPVRDIITQVSLTDGWGHTVPAVS
jgi:HTH-type transcriptional regulator/antitoxin HigA